MEPEAKFGKSRSNKRKENRALSLLLQDPRFQAPNVTTKRKILELLPVSGEFGIQTFDAIRTPAPSPAFNPETIIGAMDKIDLIEMKATTKPIRDPSLNGFFFGATKREFDMARALGARYQFAFIVLNNLNTFGRPFFVLLTLEQLERRIRQQRVQYQVNLRTDISDDLMSWPNSGIGPEILEAPI